MDFATEAEAVAKRADLRERFGPGVAALCVTPVYLRSADATSKAAKRRSIEALGWPVQMAPKKPSRR